MLLTLEGVGSGRWACIAGVRKEYFLRSISIL